MAAKARFLFAILVALLLCGCTIQLKEDSSVGFRFGTEAALYHTAPDTGAEARLDLLEWLQELIKDGGPQETPDTDGADDDDLVDEPDGVPVDSDI